MLNADPVGGILLHAVGGIAAATCYISQKGTPKWSWQTYWIVVCLTAWFLMPLIVSLLSTPDLMKVLSHTNPIVAINITLLGAAYGFGGMAFAIAIRYIGFSLTYAIAIGISAVFGTIVPSILNGTVISNFQKPGGLFVLAGFAISIVGVAVCGRAGFMKEAELVRESEPLESGIPAFNMKKGLILVIIAGILSGVFGVAVARGVSIDSIAIEYGANPQFAGYAKYIFITGGTLITNLIWWGIVHFRSKTLHEFVKHEDGTTKLMFYYLMGVIAGLLWFMQFIFYELGHVRMGEYGFISWGVHMAMLVFFSFGVGLMFKEWNQCNKRTLATLMVGLVILLSSFSFITYGSWKGEKSVNKNIPTIQE